MRSTQSLPCSSCGRHFTRLPTWNSRRTPQHRRPKHLYQSGLDGRTHQHAPQAASTDAPLSKEDLENLVREREEQDERFFGDAWVESLPQNVKQLFDETTEEYNEFERKLDVIRQMPEYKQDAAFRKHTSFTPLMVNDMIGMGTWRLKGHVDPVVEFLTGRVESSFRVQLPNDLNLYPAAKWKGPGYDFIDSMDPKREWDNFSYVDIPDPEEDDEEYPRLLIENRMYMSRAFRKLHLEVAYRQDDLSVLHCVLFPRYSFDLPILSFDVVTMNNVVTLAVLDMSPVRRNKLLPPHYVKVLMQLQEAFLTDTATQRKVPEWGQNIFSSLCVSIRPKTPEDVAGFVKYAVALVKAHLNFSHLLDPLPNRSLREKARVEEIRFCHSRFCQNHLQNVKTRRILEASLGKELAAEYMEKVMFDYDPEDDPPYVDASVQDFYTLMEKTPPKDPMWMYEKIRAAAADRRKLADSLLDAAEPAANLAASLEEAEKKQPGISEAAYQWLLDNDPEFRDIVSNLDQTWTEFQQQYGEHEAKSVLEKAEQQFKEWYIP